MRIIHFSGSDWWGGNEKQLLELSLSLNQRNIYSEIHCVQGSILAKKCQELSTPFLAEKKYKATQFTRLKQLQRYILEHEFDLIHIHTSNAVTYFMAMDFLYGKGIPAVFSRKGIGDATSVLSKIKYNYKGIEQIICVSKSVLSNFKEKMIYKKNHHKLTVVYDGVNLNNLHQNPIQLREQYKIPNDCFLVGNIANHVDAKDLFTLLAVVKSIALKNRNVHFIQIGKQTTLSQELFTLVKQHNLEKHITFTGFLENAAGLIPQMDCFMISSEREGGPSAALEAMAWNKLVISTKVGVLQEILPKALLCATKDHLCLAKKLVQMSQDQTLAIQLSKEANLAFQKYCTLEKLTNKTIEVYQKCLA